MALSPFHSAFVGLGVVVAPFSQVHAKKVKYLAIPRMKPIPVFNGSWIDSAHSPFVMVRASSLQFFCRAKRSDNRVRFGRLHLLSPSPNVYPSLLYFSLGHALRVMVRPASLSSPSLK